MMDAIKSCMGNMDNYLEFSFNARIAGPCYFGWVTAVWFIFRIGHSDMAICFIRCVLNSMGIKLKQHITQTISSDRWYRNKMCLCVCIFAFFSELWPYHWSYDCEMLTLLKSSEFSRFINCSSAASINPCMAVTTVWHDRIVFDFDWKRHNFWKEKKNV